MNQLMKALNFQLSDLSHERRQAGIRSFLCFILSFDMEERKIKKLFMSNASNFHPNPEICEVSQRILS